MSESLMVTWLSWPASGIGGLSFQGYKHVLAFQSAGGETFPSAVRLKRLDVFMTLN